MDTDSKKNAGNAEPDLEGLTLEEAYKKLDDLLRELEDPHTPLEKTFDAYREGISVLNVCKQKIDLIEKKVLTLSEEGEIGEL